MAASLNPLRCSGTELPPRLLLTAKLLALTLLLRGEVSHISRPFLPFLRFFDQIAFPTLFRRGLQGAFLLAALGLLFNRRVRACCLALAGAVLVSMLACRVLYANNRLFVAALLAMIGLEQTRPQGPRFLRWQVALVYAGAALNKLLDPDWRSGVFFDNFMAVFGMDLLRRASGLLPPLVLAKALSWGTMALESGLAALWLTGALPELTIWAALLFHTVLSSFTGTPFGNFYAASAVATLILTRPPAAPAVVLYDGDCGICARTRAFFEAVDFDGTMRWRPFQSAGDRHGIPEAALQQRLHLVEDGRVYAGFRAFKKMVLLLPASYFAGLLLFLAFMRHSCPVPALAAAWGLLAVFFPPLESVGERAYLLVARNRRRLSGAASACGVHRG